MDEIRNAYMLWLIERVMASGVSKEESVKKAADIFMDDFKEFSKDYSEKIKR